MKREDLKIPLASGAFLHANGVIPEGAQGVVIFAHGSGSSRLSPRNQWVARALQTSGLATLLVDLLTSEEEQEDQFTFQYRFDIPLLAKRLQEVTHNASKGLFRGLEVGYFGASTGAAAALISATFCPARAVVSRGGRVDLAEESLPKVSAATLLIVGEHDPEVLALNQGAYAQLRCTKQLKIVPGATHLFEEPGALEEVAKLAADWFNMYLKLSGDV